MNTLTHPNQTGSRVRVLRLLAHVSLCMLLAVPLAPGGALAQGDPHDASPPRVLVYSGTHSQRHSSSIHEGNLFLEDMADEGDDANYVIDFTEDPADITLDTLRNYDLVVRNSPSGHLFDGIGAQHGAGCVHDAGDSYTCTSAPFDAQQRDEFVAWSECGGGTVGIHQALDAWDDWDEWNELTGWTNLVFQGGEAEVYVEADSPIVAPFGPAGSSLLLFEEYYTTLPGDVDQTIPQYQQLLGLGEFTDSNTETVQGALFPDHSPIAWTSSFRDANRVFFTHLGHFAATWRDLPAFQEHILAGIEFVAEVRPDPGCLAGLSGPAA